MYRRTRNMHFLSRLGNVGINIRTYYLINRETRTQGAVRNASINFKGLDTCSGKQSIEQTQIYKLPGFVLCPLFFFKYPNVKAASFAIKRPITLRSRYRYVFRWKSRIFKSSRTANEIYSLE